MRGIIPEVERVHDEPLSRMGRRRFVKTLVAAGFSLASASQLSAGDFKPVSEDEVPVVYAYAREDPDDPSSVTPRIKTVGAEWYNGLQAALSNYETLDLTDLEGVLSASVVPGEGDDQATISVEVTRETAMDQVTDLIDEVPVEGSIIDTAANGSHPALEPERQFDPDSGPAVPGGVACGESEGLATLAPAVYDPESDTRYFATASHLYADTGSTELTLVCPDQRIGVGEVERRHHDEDIALVRSTGEYEPAHALHRSTPERIVGQFSRLGLADLKARGVDVHKIGAMSGHTTGRIKAIDGISCIYGDPCKRGQLKWGSESDFTDGDSGSVSYAPDPEDPDERALVCGLNNARTWWPGEDYIWGTGAYVLHERYGYTF